MFDKVAEILGKLNGMILLIAALGIVVVVFVLGVVFALGGDLGKFKKVAKKVIKEPTLNNCNATAKELPIRARKQYKTVKQTGCKPDDAITPDACVYAPFKESAAAHMPGAVMAAGILAILFSFFAAPFVKESAAGNLNIVYVLPAVVTAGVMIFRLAAGLVSSAILKSGMKAYNGYVGVLGKVLSGGGAAAHEAGNDSAPAYEHSTGEPRAYDATFDAPERITVELAEEENEVKAEPVTETVAEAETVVMAEPVEDEAAQKARARAEAMAAARAEQAAAQAAAAQAAQAAAQKAAEQAAAQAAAHATAAQAQPVHSNPAPAQAATSAAASSADEVIARIETIKREGAPITAMKEVALALQKERAKPENKTPEMQRKLNEALAALLKAMSSANKK